MGRLTTIALQRTVTFGCAAAGPSRSIHKPVPSPIAPFRLLHRPDNPHLGVLRPRYSESSSSSKLSKLWLAWFSRQRSVCRLWGYSSEVLANCRLTASNAQLARTDVAVETVSPWKLPEIKSRQDAA